MQTFELFIGANNTTNKVEHDKLESILSGYADGYSIIPVKGYWLGKPEESVQVLIAVDDVTGLIKELKTVLQQDAIAFRPVTALQFI